MTEPTIQIDPKIEKRLQEEQVIWLTTVDSRGTPQPNPVWFFWDGGRFIIYTPPASAKLKNLARNPMVSLNFEGADALGGDVVVFTGQAKIDPACPAVDPGYARKYLSAARDLGSTVEDFFTQYSVEITVVPSKVRTF
jgi:PPOX class probable F420-dependent enzyme